MNAPAPIPDPEAFCGDVPGDAVDDPARALIERQLAWLGRVAEAGLQVALAVEGRAKAAGPDDDLNAVAMAYARAARAVRLTVMLQSRLVQTLQAHDAAAARKAARAAVDPEAETHKARVERIIQRVAMAERDDEEAVDALIAEADERLDDDDIYGDILSRPVGELVALICRDLGLDPDWSALAREAWALEEIASGVPGSPFAALGPAEAGSPPLEGKPPPAQVRPPPS